MAPNDGSNTRRRRVLRRSISFYHSQNITWNFPETSPVVVHYCTVARLKVPVFWFPSAGTKMVSTPIPFKPKPKEFGCPLGKQADIVPQLQLETILGHLMRTYNVSCRTLYNIKKKKDDISKAATMHQSPWKQKQYGLCTFQNWKRSCTNLKLFVVQTNFLSHVASFNSVHLWYGTHFWMI